MPKALASHRAEVRFEPMGPARLDAVLEVEKRTYAHPWNRANFQDVLHSGYQAQILMADTTIVGYFVAMKGVDEVHLLNITVAPEYQGQGWARMMLDALDIWARSQNAETLWLEVRIGNTRARQVYERYGFAKVGQRKNYYAAGRQEREDALVMTMRLA